MRTSEIIRSVFDLYRQHFFPLILINTIVVIPLLLFNITTSLEIRIGTIVYTCLLLFLFLISFITTYLGLAATTVAASNAVLGRPVKIAGTFRRIFSLQLIWRLIVAAWEASITIATGFLLFVLPAIIIWVWYLFVPLVLILEKNVVRSPVLESTVLERSRQLILGHFWRLLFTYGILYFIPYLVFSFIIGILIAIVGEIIGIDSSSIRLASYFLGSFYSVLVTPIGNLLLTLLYYDLRARKESYNEEYLAQEMGYEPIGEMLTV